MSLQSRRWRPKPLIKNSYVSTVTCLAIITYLFFAIGSLDVNWLRVFQGLSRAAALWSGFLHPDFTSRWDDIRNGLLESLTMTFTASIVGLVFAIPFSIGAARNIVPMPIYVFCRGVIAISRSLQEIIVALFFVVLLGFGPLAGFLTLVFSTIGFIAKLLAEDIEDTSPRQLEALRATGAGFYQIVVFAILPQIMPRLTGLFMYRIDINFRDSAVIGIVGAGGIGATLNTAMERYEFGSAAAILLIIILIVVLCEYTSGYVRSRLN